MNSQPRKTYAVPMAVSLILGACSGSKPTDSTYDAKPHDVHTFEQIERIGSSGDGPAEFNKPVGIAVQKNAIYIADTGNNRVQQLSISGGFVRQWQNLERPMHMDLDPSGNLAVAMYLTDRVQIFSGDNPIRDFGGDWLDGPSAVAWVDRGWVIADFYHHQVHVVSNDGERQRTFGGKGETQGKLNYPTDVATDASGAIWVADAYNNRVQSFDAEGNPQKMIGGYGKGPGEFRVPTAIAFDEVGHLYVCDSENDRVQVFFEDTFEVEMGVGVLEQPQDIAISGSKVFVLDHGNDRIVVFQRH